MLIFVVIVVIAAIGALVVAAFMRSGGDDGSVRSYHSALGTLEHLSDPDRRPRRSSGHGAPGAPGAAPVGYEPTRSVPPVPVRGNVELPYPEETLVFDEARPRDRYAPASVGERRTPARSNRVQRMALDSMNRRSHRGTGVAVAVAVVVAFGVLAYFGSRHHPSPTRASTTRTTTAPTTHPVSHHTNSAGRTTTSSTTTTTMPAKLVASTTSATGAAATYAVPGAAYTVSIAATGPCWVDVITAASGATLWTGTLQAGQVQKVSATGATTVELGSTMASMKIGTTPVVFPSPLHTPFVATFQPPAASPPPAGTTATTTPATAAAGPSAG